MADVAHPLATQVTEVAIEPVEGGVTAPLGFRSAALHCGIKAKPGALDLAVLAADTAVPTAGLFTTNLAVAAPVTLCRQHLERARGEVRAIVVNSGCANACTGEQGMQDARAMASAVAGAIDCDPEQVLVASTGVIGVALPMASLLPGIATAVTRLARGAGADTARAIMTTDPFPKEHAVAVHVAGGPATALTTGRFTVGGMAKGSGMIEPNMATMLGFLTTDAQVPPALLRRALRAAARDTFNAITVDGECSTNDSLFAMASGRSGVTIDDRTYPAFLEALRTVSRELALGIVRGGEGATKLIAITVSDARSEDDARRIARTIANSPLVKTAVHGADPNWGRIVASAGRSGVVFDMNRTSVRVGGVLLFENGLPHDDAAPRAAEHLHGRDIRIDVTIGSGGGYAATIWTCDLSAEYVRINGEYRT
jgi:glutamate N-acetyltransferase / amino-acid N-acetyltransferase